MAFDLPALDCGNIYAQTINRTEESDRDQKKSHGIDDHQDKEMDKLPRGRPKILGTIKVSSCSGVDLTGLH